MSSTQKQTGAAQTLAILQQLGVTDIFGYPGGAIMPIYDALYSSEIKHYLCRHEQGAAFAAVGYARASGKVGVCMATSGPGATNLITGLADAMADSVAVVAITGQVATHAMGTDGFQEVDIISLSLACTKHSFQIRKLSDLPKTLTQAFHIATSGRPGPVLIDIPKNIQIAEVNNHFALSSSEPDISPVISSESQQSIESSASFEQAAQLIKSSTQPVLYIGGGVGMAGATDELKNLMQRLKLPNLATLKGLGAVPIDEPYYLGMLGMHGSHQANLAIQECDLMLVIGARFDDRATGKLNEFAPNAKVIHMDIDPAEINKRRIADVILLGDLKITLPQLFSRLSGFDTANKKRIDWREKCISRNNSLEDSSSTTSVPESTSETTGIIAPKLLANLSQLLAANNSAADGSQSINNFHVTTDVGQHQMWAAQYMRFDHPEQFLSSSGLGTMGFGIPAAIGAQISHPNAQVISISGDGSFMMNVQELATIKRYQLPVKILLIDNSRLGLVRQWQQLFFEQRYSETDLSDNPDFVTLAKAFDIEATTITQQSQVSDALQNMLAHQGPYLLHVKIDAFENVWPLVPPETANDKMIQSIN